MKRSPMKRTGRLRPRSKKTERKYVERRKIVSNLLSTRAKCEAGIIDVCVGKAVDVHEVKTRGRGGSILDEENLRCLCRPCHQYVTEHPKEAHALGLVVHAWE
jgi:hypothetical protein